MFAGIGLHRIQQIRGLKRDSFERRPGDVRSACTASQPDDRAARFLVPMGRSKAGKRGDKVNASVIVYRGRQLLNLSRGLDDPERIAKPLNNSTAYEDAAL